MTSSMFTGAFECPNRARPTKQSSRRARLTTTRSAAGRRSTRGVLVDIRQRCCVRVGPRADSTWGAFLSLKFRSTTTYHGHASSAHCDCNTRTTCTDESSSTTHIATTGDAQLTIRVGVELRKFLKKCQKGLGDYKASEYDGGKFNDSWSGGYVGCAAGAYA